MKMLLGLFALLLWASNAQAVTTPWIEVDSPHFVVLTNGLERDGRHVAGQLERLRAVFRKVFATGNDDGEPPITVFAFKDRKSFEAMLPGGRLPRGNGELAGVFFSDRDLTEILLRLDVTFDHPYASVYHEYTHYILRRSVTWLPLWLNEGLAQFYENTEIDEKTARMGEPSVSLVSELRENQLIPLSALFAVDEQSPYYHKQHQMGIFYAESWALTHLLAINDMKDKTHLLRDFAGRLQQHEDSTVAAQETFGDLQKLEPELKAYINRQSFGFFTVSVGPGVDEMSFTAHETSQAVVDARQTAMMGRDGREAEAQALLDKLVVQEPGDETVLQAMGWMQLHTGHMKESQMWFQKVLKLDPDNYWALYFYSVAAVRLKDRSRDAEVEAMLKRAIQLQPRYSYAYDCLASLYAHGNRNLTEAHVLEAKAVELEPEVLVYWINAAWVLDLQKQYASALSVLNAAKKVTRTPEDEANVDKRIAEVQKHKTETAQAVAQ